MFHRTITFEDYNGNQQTETLYFNLTKSQIARTELLSDGGWSARLKRISESRKGSEIVREFEEILKMAYGVKSEDGLRHDKSDEIWEEFTKTAAYDAFFFRLVTDAEYASEFVNELLPQEQLKQMQEAGERNQKLGAAAATAQASKSGPVLVPAPEQVEDAQPKRPTTELSMEELMEEMRRRKAEQGD